MTYHKITVRDIDQAIVKNLPKENFPTACVYKDESWFVRIHKAAIKRNGKICGVQYQFVLLGKESQRKIILGTLYLLNPRDPACRGMDFAWKNEKFDASVVGNLVWGVTYTEAAFAARREGRPFKMPRPNTDWVDLPTVGPNIALELAKKQGKFDDVNVNWENLDYTVYLQSAELKDGK